MKTLIYLLAAVLAFFGFMFIAGSQGIVLRIVVGVILLAAAIAMVYMNRARPQVVRTETTVVQKIDLSGDVSLEQMTCNSCGAALSKNSIEVKAGAIFVNCEYCGASYQIEEAPKW